MSKLNAVAITKICFPITKSNLFIEITLLRFYWQEKKEVNKVLIIWIENYLTISQCCERTTTTTERLGQDGRIVRWSIVYCASRRLEATWTVRIEWIVEIRYHLIKFDTKTSGNWGRYERKEGMFVGDTERYNLSSWWLNKLSSHLALFDK